MAVTSTDYTGRTVDAWAYSGPYVGQLRADLFGNQVCAGIIKLAQRWLICLLTETGSARFNPEYGTSFMTRMKTGLRAETDIAAAFLIASQELGDQLVEMEVDGLPDDERYDRCDLLSVTVTGEWQIHLKVRIYSAAGDSRTVLVPVRGDLL